MNVGRDLSPERGWLWLRTALSSPRCCVQRSAPCGGAVNGFSKFLQVYWDLEMLDAGGGEDMGVS